MRLCTAVVSLVAIVGCARRPPAAGHDASAALPAPTIAQVDTCSTYVLDSPRGAIARDGRVLPTELLHVHGRGLEGASRAELGGVAVGLTREGASLTVRVPPLLASGAQTLRLFVGTCEVDARVRVTRVGVRFSAAHWTAFDLDDLSPLRDGALDAPPLQAAVSYDGAGFVLRTADGAVRWQPFAGAAVSLGVADRPFALAQADVAPHRLFVTVSSARASSLVVVRTDVGTVERVETPGGAPLGVAIPLDGFRAAVLDRQGFVDALDRPLDGTSRVEGAATPTLRRAPPRANDQRLRAASEIAVAQGGAYGPTGPLGVVVDQGVTPTLVPMDLQTGRLGRRIPVVALAGNVRFVAGDILAMDSRRPELLAADITALDGELWRIPLPGEGPARVERTVTAVSLYKVAALVLRRTPTAPEGDRVHVMNYHHEPPDPCFATALPHARGVVATQGHDSPFVVWGARFVARLSGEVDAVRARWDAPATEPDVALVALQP